MLGKDELASAGLRNTVTTLFTSMFYSHLTVGMWGDGTSLSTILPV